MSLAKGLQPAELSSGISENSSKDFATNYVLQHLYTPYYCATWNVIAKVIEILYQKQMATTFICYSAQT